MRIVKLIKISEIDQHLTEWNRLAPNPMLTPLWQLAWWRSYASQDSSLLNLFILCVLDDSDQLVGLAPWYIQKNSLGTRTLRFLGDGEVCSDHLTLLTAEGWKEQVPLLVAEYLRTQETEWDKLQLEGIDGDDPKLALLGHALHASGFPIQFRPNDSCWRLELPATWEEYLSLLSKSHRKRCRRLQRTYFDSRRVVLRQVQNQKQLAYGMKILRTLHAERWGDHTQGGRFGSTDFAAFHKEVAKAFYDRGLLRLSWLELDGTPVAAEYQFAFDGVLYAYQSGIATARLEDQPGNLSLMATIQQAIQDGYQAIDLLRGDEPYKAHWRATPAACHDLCVWRDSLRGQLGQRASLARETAKQWVRKGKQIIGTA